MLCPISFSDMHFLDVRTKRKVRQMFGKNNGNTQVHKTSITEQLGQNKHKDRLNRDSDNIVFFLLKKKSL